MGYFYNKEIGLYIGQKISSIDIEVSEEEFNTLNESEVEVVEGQLVAVTKSFEETLEQRLEVISTKFLDMFKVGTFTSSLGFPVDNRRYAEKHDKDNVNTMINTMERTGMTEATFMDAEGKPHVLPLADWKILLAEMEADGLSKYQWKWTKEAEVKACETVEEFDEIII